MNPSIRFVSVGLGVSVEEHLRAYQDAWLGHALTDSGGGGLSRCRRARWRRSCWSRRGRWMRPSPPRVLSCTGLCSGSPRVFSPPSSRWTRSKVTSSRVRLTPLWTVLLRWW